MNIENKICDRMATDEKFSKYFILNWQTLNHSNIVTLTTVLFFNIQTLSYSILQPGNPLNGLSSKVKLKTIRMNDIHCYWLFFSASIILIRLYSHFPVHHRSQMSKKTLLSCLFNAFYASSQAIFWLKSRWPSLKCISLIDSERRRGTRGNLILSWN